MKYIVFCFAIIFPMGIYALSPTYLSDHFNTLFASHANDTAFTFYAHSDMHYDACGINSGYVNTLTACRTAGNAFVVCVGDWGYGTQCGRDGTRDAIAAVSNCPAVLPVMGNHEGDGVGKKAWLDALAPGVIPDGAWAASSPAGNADAVYFSFNYGTKYLFIAVDSDHTGYDGTIDSTQAAWFINQVRSNPDKHIVVFSHWPMDFLGGYAGDYGLLCHSRGLILKELDGHITQNRKQAWVLSGHMGNAYKGSMLSGVKTAIVFSTYSHFSINGDSITCTDAGTWIDMTTTAAYKPQIDPLTGDSTIWICNDSVGGIYHNPDTGPDVTVVSAENGVTPVTGTKMLKHNGITWPENNFLSSQMIVVRPGMKFSYNIYIRNCPSGADDISVQPYIVADYNVTVPVATRINDQNGLGLDSWYGNYVLLGGRATNTWYYREFNLDTLSRVPVTLDMFHMDMGEGAAFTDGEGPIYIDDIKVRWPVETTPVQDVEATRAVGITATPNPFNPTTKIVISGQRVVGSIKIEIYSIHGKLVQILPAAGCQLPAGITWDASSQPSGVYVISAMVGTTMYSKKITLVR